MMQLAGRLHPILVHLPIGILLLAWVMECLSRYRGKTDLNASIRLSLQLGWIAALVSAGSGWWLAEEGGYEAQTLLQHRWLGMSTVLLFGATYLLRTTRWYFPLFTISTLILAVAGHFGGALTHGEDFLAGAHDAQEATNVQASAFTPESQVFSTLVQPILRKKCVSCHRMDKHKGDLMLDTEAGILRGGKHGAVILAGNPDSSELLLRARLPQQHDDHMPPAGKPQLSDLEIRVLEWWIREGADFKATFNEKPLPEALAAGFKVDESPVYALTVSPAAPEAIRQLQSLGFRVQLRSAGQPWLMISATGRQDLDRQHWEALASLSKQVTDLDLSHSNADDRRLASMELPHLVRLNMAHSKVGDGMLAFLKNTPFLESLNLTGTAVSDALGTVLSKLPHLKRLYLWQSKITEAQTSAWKQAYPKLQIETKGPEVGNQALTLRPPTLLYGRSFFDDTMHVDLSFPFKGVDIYYTLDEAASPTTASPKYRETIVLDKSSHLRAFAAKEGWQYSPLVDALFVRKKYTIAEAKLLHPPSSQYPAKGAPSLIDGQIGQVKEDAAWLGFEGEHMDALLDLGQPQEVRNFYLHTLEHNPAWIHRPVSITVYSSTDGKRYTESGRVNIPPNTTMGEPKVQLIGCPLAQATSARYWKVHVHSLLKNPPWHSGKGNKCWIFVDEITVE